MVKFDNYNDCYLSSVEYNHDADCMFKNNTSSHDI